VSAVGTALFCHVKVEDFASHLITYYYERSVSVSDKASGIIYQCEYWMGRIENHHHLFCPYLKLIIYVFVSSSSSSDSFFFDLLDLLLK